jgi:hypothetical protein
VSAAFAALVAAAAGDAVTIDAASLWAAGRDLVILLAVTGVLALVAWSLLRWE